MEKTNHIMIYGAGLSGLGAACLAKQNGYIPIVYDQNQITEKISSQLNIKKIDYFSGSFDNTILSKIELVIKSPGIPENNEIIRLIKNASIPIIGELEFASRYSKAKLIGITGTNGKTTTTLLVHHILKKAGIKVGLAGNLDPCLSTLIINNSYDWIVLEISSFQLDNMILTKMNIACILNITNDHLDRYENFQEYVNSKLKILNNMTREDYFLYNGADPILRKNLIKRQIVPKTINIDCKNVQKNFYKNLLGKHNQINADCAHTIARILNIPNTQIEHSIKNFVLPKHRLKSIGKIKNVEFWNDSKATNLAAAKVALEMLDGPIIWIAGGVDKGNDYQDILEIITKKVKAIICLCLDAEKLIKTFSCIVPMYHARNMTSTVELALGIARTGDQVLLAPACASFDLFSSYKERGEQFEYEYKKHESFQLKMDKILH